MPVLQSEVKCVGAPYNFFKVATPCSLEDPQVAISSCCLDTFVHPPQNNVEMHLHFFDMFVNDFFPAAEYVPISRKLC